MLKLLISVLALSVLGLICTITYALHARDSAIRGWASAAQQQAINRDAGAGDTLKKLADSREANRWMLAKNAEIKPEDDAKKIAEKLTKHIYSETNFSGPYIETNNDLYRYLLTISHQTFNYCSSLSSTLKWALDLFGVKSRIVNIAAEEFFVDTETDTHTFVEAMISGKPVVFDPTFNATYSCDGGGEAVDARALFDCVKQGKNIQPNYLSKPRPGRSLAEYYISLEKLFYAIDAVDETDDGLFYRSDEPFSDWLRSTQRKYAEQRESTSAATP